MASHYEHWKELPSFLLKRRNWACLIKNAVHYWVSGVWDVGLMVSLDSHGSCGAGQAAPVPALLASHPRPSGFCPSDSAILLHSSPGSGYHGSCTILTLPAQRIVTVALFVSACVECGIFFFWVFYSSFTLRTWEGGAGKGSTSALFWSWGWGISCVSSTSPYGEVGTVSSLDPSLFPAPHQCPTEFFTNMGA